METRLILQIVLGVIIALVVVMGGLMIYALTRQADTVIVQELVDEETLERERRNPWADQGDAAIALVQRSRVRGDAGVEVEGNLTVGRLMEEETFLRETMKIETGEVAGWEAQWWGETRHGPSFYLVRYAIQDEEVTIGPAWLVDLQTQKVVPKNVPAQVASRPQEGTQSKYYDQDRQVISAMTSHRFSSQINLGGAMLRYFQEMGQRGDDDRVLGWTVDHDREELFQVYFQWTEDGTPTYAHFEFDFDQRALRGANLQAHEIMRVGEEVEPLERVSIMAQSYDPTERIAANRWQGATRAACRRANLRDQCRAMATILDHNELIETLEWVLTEDSDSAEKFQECQARREDGPPVCRWHAERVRAEDGEEASEAVQAGQVYRVRYLYQIGDGEEQSIGWKVNLRSERVEPLDGFSELAYRAVRPRG